MKPIVIKSGLSSLTVGRLLLSRGVPTAKRAVCEFARILILIFHR